MRHAFLSFMTIAAVVVVPARESATADDQTIARNVDLNAVLVALNSPDFATREAAQGQLRGLNANQVSLLSGHAETTPAAETAISCVRALEHHLLGEDAISSRTAWEALEALLGSDRHLVREDVSWVLSNHGEIRAKLTIEALRENGALIVLPEARAAAKLVHNRRRVAAQGGARNQAPRGLFFRRPLVLPTVQVFFTDEWRGNLIPLKLLQRLPGLQTYDAQAFGANARVQQQRRFGGPNRNQPAPVTVFLIAGNSLDTEAEAAIKGAFGQRVQERPEVMLGITADGVTAGSGCSITSVVPFGSGDAAGLMSGDRIVAVAEQKIAGFNDLVDELRSHSTGDTVAVEVIRGGRRLEAPISIPIALRSWKNYVESVNTAAAEEWNSSVPDAIVPKTEP